MREITLKKTIKYCSKCPHCEEKRFYTADSFECEDTLTCTLCNKKRGIFEWKDEGKYDTIPEWCPLLKE